ncbi:MAG: gamma-glutamyl-gamma-aminobutyrate hydrolase family protein [Blastocatellia bacterium]|nr:gamma-glutamyl-gamma-aminobutyrate hydrolase family protein [Blastocatellia bacterium]
MPRSASFSNTSGNPQGKGRPRPLIGITTRLDAENQFYLRRYYGEAIFEAGGAPLYLPLIPHLDYLTDVIERLDGVVFSGSNSDLDPVSFGEEPHPRLGAVIPERDAMDLLLLDLAEQHATPVLAICYGMQSLNVARGGSLFQDIESLVENPVKHEQGRPADRPSHTIEIEPDSILGQVADRMRMRVNSSHHQAVKRVGRNLRVTARAADGIVEAIEDTRPDRFVLGVQWHPETGWERDPFSQALFARFVEAAAERCLEKS